LSRQCGILNISQPYRPPRPVTGIVLLVLYYKARGKETAWKMDLGKIGWGDMEWIGLAQDRDR
jgi:hypothetical protein